MKIELIAKHAAGQPITVVCESTGRRANYDFVDDGNGRRIADVTEKGHIARMLQSPDVWVVYDPDANPNEPKGTKEASPAGIGTEPPPPPAGDSKTVGDMTDEELREYAKAKYDRKFHPSAKRDTMLAEIANLGG